MNYLLKPILLFFSSISLILTLGSCNRDDNSGDDQTDTNIPFVEILNPVAQSGTVPKNVQIEVDVAASGTKNITQVDFYVDDQLLANGSVKTSPYTYQWEVDSKYGETRTISVIAHDDQGFTGTASVDVVIWNGRQGTQMPTTRYAFSLNEVNGKLYAIGGYNDDNTAFKVVEEYDPATDTWTTKASSNEGHAAHASCAIDDIIYVFGGDKGEKWHAGVEAYDPATDSWSPKDSIPLDTNVGRGLQACTVLDGKAYVFGGEASNLETITGVYDPESDSWSIQGQKHVFNAEAITLNNTIYLLGGCTTRSVGKCEDPLKTVETYDPVKFEFAEVSSMLSGRFGHSVTEHNGKLYAFGGSGNSPDGNVEIEVYDPDKDEWTQLLNMPTNQMNFGCVALNGTIYIVGSKVYAYTPE